MTDKKVTKKKERKEGRNTCETGEDQGKICLQNINYV